MGAWRPSGLAHRPRAVARLSPPGIGLFTDWVHLSGFFNLPARETHRQMQRRLAAEHRAQPALARREVDRRVASHRAQRLERQLQPRPAARSQAWRRNAEADVERGHVGIAQRHRPARRAVPCPARGEDGAPALRAPDRCRLPERTPADEAHPRLQQHAGMRRASRPSATPGGGGRRAARPCASAAMRGSTRQASKGPAAVPSTRATRQLPWSRNGPGRSPEPGAHAQRPPPGVGVGEHHRGASATPHRRAAASGPRRRWSAASRARSTARDLLPAQLQADLGAAGEAAAPPEGDARPCGGRRRARWSAVPPDHRTVRRRRGARREASRGRIPDADPLHRPRAASTASSSVEVMAPSRLGDEPVRAPVAHVPAAAPGAGRGPAGAPVAASSASAAPRSRRSPSRASRPGSERRRILDVGGDRPRPRRDAPAASTRQPKGAARSDPRARTVRRGSPGARPPGSSALPGGDRSVRLHSDLEAVRGDRKLQRERRRRGASAATTRRWRASHGSSGPGAPSVIQVVSSSVLGTAGSVSAPASTPPQLEAGVRLELRPCSNRCRQRRPPPSPSAVARRAAASVQRKQSGDSVVPERRAG